MKIEQVRECQLWQLKALKFIDKVCRDNGLKYFAHAGTLLGAARHSGYIPWDMDTDIVMPREDCLKLVSIINQMDNPNYKAKFTGQGMGCSERLVVYTVKCFGEAVIEPDDKFVHIDIYSYDNATQLDSIRRMFYGYKSKFLNRLISYRNGVTAVANPVNKLMLEIAKILYKRRTDKQIRSAILKLAICDVDSEIITIFNSFYGFGKETYPKYIFEETVFLNFEDIEIPAPRDYKIILSNLYGDWTKLPPEAKRYPDYLERLNYEVIGERE